MSILKELLSQPDFKDLTNQQVYDHLNTDGVVLRVDSVRHDWVGVAKIMALDGVDPMLIASMPQILAQCAGGEMLANMLGCGIDFSDDLMRQNLVAFSALSAAVPNATVLFNALLQVGIKTGFNWKYYSLSSLPTLEEIAAERTVVVTRQQEGDRLVNAWTVVSNAWAAEQINTFAEAIDLMKVQ